MLGASKVPDAHINEEGNKVKTIAILYIATGKYTVFWEEFYTSSEQFFLPNQGYQKEYFVFTDADSILHEENEHVHRIPQESLPWPYITLDRFSIFQKARKQLEGMDYIYFFNGNMLFVEPINEELIPSSDKPLVMVEHPGFFNKKREAFTYETSQDSLAYIAPNEGDSYVMGGLNGGKSKEYLALIDELEIRINRDKESGVIALWHDESHLNRYAIDVQEQVTILNPSYGYPEGWGLPYTPKIIIRDKARYGGHHFLRNQKKRRPNFPKRIFRRILGGNWGVSHLSKRS